MSRYLVGRMLQLIPLIIGISFATFVLIQMAPGGPAILMSPDISHEDMLRIRANLGLDDPLLVQFWRWFVNMLRLDFGKSFTEGRPVAEMVLERLPATLILAAAALLTSIAVAVPAGILAATRRYTTFDYLVTVGAFVGISIPTFWFGLLLIIVFAVKLQWLPAGGMASLGGGFALGDFLRHLAMPAVVLGFYRAAALTRYVRASMIEVIRQDFIRTARAKGLSGRAVLFRHAVRNAMIPVVTMVGLSLPQLVGGSVLVESIFAWPGMGRLAVDAAFQRDYPVTMAVTIVISAVVLLGSALTDVLYALVDPRIRYE